MPAATAAPARHRANTARETLRCRVRLADGRVFSGPLGPERHRALQLGILHGQTTGLVEIAAGARREGRLQITTRRRADHFLPGGRAGGGDWLGPLVALAARHADAGEEVFLAPAVRAQPRGDKHAVSETRFLWVDVDRPDGLPALWTFLAERPCHLLIESSAGHAHAYWKLDRPLPATRGDRVDRRAGRADRARAPAADPPPRDRRGRQAERRRPGVRGAVEGDAARRQRERQDRRARPDPRGRPRAARLPDRAARRRPARSDPGDTRHAPAATPATAADPYKRIGPREYFERLAGIVVPRDGLVHCPAHEDRIPSCSVGTDASQGWRCHAGTCGARGAIYDLASVLLGGPWGPQLRGEAFKRARAYVVDVFGELPEQRQEPAKE